MKAWFAAFCALSSLAAVSRAEPPDQFAGTLQKEGAQWVLTRCDLVKHRYLLRDADGQAEGFDALLPAEAKRADSAVTVAMAARYLQRDDGDALRVSRVLSVQPGSCHLDALFD